MKLCLGTVQLGMDYGIRGKKKPSQDESREILDYAVHNGIDMIDTANAYGEAENVIGAFLEGEPHVRMEEIEQAAKHFQNVQLYKNVTNMSELMQKCDIAVSAAGTTLYELCACGVPTVTYILADNQILSARAFEKAGLMRCAGDVRIEERFGEEIFRNLSMLICDEGLRRQMAGRLQRTTDGNGARLLVKELGNIEGESRE